MVSYDPCMTTMDGNVRFTTVSLVENPPQHVNVVGQEAAWANEQANALNEVKSAVNQMESRDKRAFRLWLIVCRAPVHRPPIKRSSSRDSDQGGLTLRRPLVVAGEASQVSQA
jgi:hypothetical protein